MYDGKMDASIGQLRLSQTQQPTQRGPRDFGTGANTASASEGLLASHATSLGTSPPITAPSDPTWPTDAMASLHLSGSEPKVFPGVFTRGNRSGSLRVQSQVDEYTLNGGNPTERRNGT